MPDLSLESQYVGKVVAGVDEVGRGPLAGPVVAAAVIIDQDNLIPGIKDSKKLSKLKREEISNFLKQSSIYSIAEASVEEIDKYNILEATRLAMNRAMDQLSKKADVFLVDGNMNFDKTHVKSFIKGDDISISIAAASIIAKVHRDSLMKEFSLQYPEYHWEQNSGYGTKMHVAAIQAHGITPFHRKKFVSRIHF